ncbi:MAG: hypothetical protein K8L97_28990 [Anaerolineae bacterium]|nr:hypothetical protein [Anaerolineae bacterium]
MFTARHNSWRLTFGFGITAALFGLMVGAQTAASWWMPTTAVLEYDVFRPAEEMVYTVYADVDRQLSVQFPFPIPVTPIENLDRRADGWRVFSMPTAGSGNADIFIVKPGGIPRQLSDFPPRRGGRDARRSSNFPRWSADGAWIAFVSSDEAGQVDLYIMRADGSDLRLIAERIRTRLPLRPRWVMFE